MRLLISLLFIEGQKNYYRSECKNTYDVGGKFVKLSMAFCIRRRRNMSVMSVNSNSNSVEYYKDTTSGTKIEDTFSMEMQEEPEKMLQKEQELPGTFKGSSFEDIFYSGKFKANPIPVVNQIVSAKNPEDGEIYLTCFTDNQR